MVEFQGASMVCMCANRGFRVSKEKRGGFGQPVHASLSMIPLHPKKFGSGRIAVPLHRVATRAAYGGAESTDGCTAAGYWQML